MTVQSAYVCAVRVLQWRRHGGGGGAFQFVCLFCLSAQRSVMAMMIILLPHYDNLSGKMCEVRKKNVSESPPPLLPPPAERLFQGWRKIWASRSSSETFCPPPPPQVNTLALPLGCWFVISAQPSECKPAPVIFAGWKCFYDRKPRIFGVQTCNPIRKGANLLLKGEAIISWQFMLQTWTIILWARDPPYTNTPFACSPCMSGGVHTVVDLSIILFVESYKKLNSNEYVY